MAEGADRPCARAAVDTNGIPTTPTTSTTRRTKPRSTRSIVQKWERALVPAKSCSGRAEGRGKSPASAVRDLGELGTEPPQLGLERFEIGRELLMRRGHLRKLREELARLLV